MKKNDSGTQKRIEEKKTYFTHLVYASSKRAHTHAQQTETHKMTTQLETPQSKLKVEYAHALDTPVSF